MAKSATVTATATRAARALTPLLQRLDSIFHRRVRREQGRPARTVVDAHGFHGGGQFTGIEAAQTGQRVDHGFAVAHQLGRARIGAKFAMT